MILNAIDEILFWQEIEMFKSFMKELYGKYYPHDPEMCFKEKKNYLDAHIPDKNEFIKRLSYYAENGKPKWAFGRNELSDDIDLDSLIKSITISSKIQNGESKAQKTSKQYDAASDFYNYYADSILHTQNNIVLELTIGAGMGTNAVMRNMSESDYYIGVDIDFVCAKNADAIAKYYNVNGLGIATSLWNMPFEDSMFTAVCCNCGLEECREIDAIIREAARVLAFGGRLVIHCSKIENRAQQHIFDDYEFSQEEKFYWLEKVRLLSDEKQLLRIANDCNLLLLEKKVSADCGTVYVFEKHLT